MTDTRSSAATTGAIARIRAATTGTEPDMDFSGVDPVEDIRLLLAEYDRVLAHAQGAVNRGALLELLANAYNEGFGEGMREHTSSKGGWPWNSRKQKYGALLDKALPSPAPSSWQPIDADALRKATIEECAQVADEQAITFLSPEYATNQPFSSIGERFACGQIASVIRALSLPSTNREGK